MWGGGVEVAGADQKDTGHWPLVRADYFRGVLNEVWGTGANLW